LPTAPPETLFRSTVAPAALALGALPRPWSRPPTAIGVPGRACLGALPARQQVVLLWGNEADPCLLSARERGGSDLPSSFEPRAPAPSHGEVHPEFPLSLEG